MSNIREGNIPKTRLIWGGVIFISGFFAPLLVPLVAKTDLSVALKTTITGLLVIGIPEIFMLVAVAILGKDGYKFLKGKLSGLLKKYGPPEHVSPLRYKVGLVLFIAPFLLGWLQPYVESHIIFLDTYSIYFNVGGDILLLISLITLGGEFWEKLRALFIQKAIVQINTEKNN